LARYGSISWRAGRKPKFSGVRQLETYCRSESGRGSCPSWARPGL
jgi:hypothetical protein